MSTVNLQTYAVDQAHTTVGFAVRHLMISSVRGRFAAFEGNVSVPEGSAIPESVELTIDASSIDTREPQRDGHLRSADFFDVEKFPTITFKSTRIEGSGSDFAMHGDLTIHGVTRPVTLEGTVEGEGPDPWGGRRIGYEARGKINRKDFGLTWNQALETGGVVVGDEIKLEIAAELVHNAAAA